MTATNLCIQSIPLLAALALCAIAFTGTGDNGTICRVRRDAAANTIVCHARHDEGYAPHACAPGMNDQTCLNAINENKQSLRRLPQNWWRRP